MTLQCVAGWYVEIFYFLLPVFLGLLGSLQVMSPQRWKMPCIHWVSGHPLYNPVISVSGHHSHGLEVVDYRSSACFQFHLSVARNHPVRVDQGASSRLCCNGWGRARQGEVGLYICGSVLPSEFSCNEYRPQAWKVCFSFFSLFWSA